LSINYSVNVKTIAKHRKRDFLNDKSSRSNKIHYAITPLEKELTRVVRTLTWMELDETIDINLNGTFTFIFRIITNDETKTEDPFIFNIYCPTRM
jgi:DNA integrity scanning protein DisA with diadenylate cyclase activity